MDLINLLILVLILGVIGWAIQAIPMPQPFKVAAWAIMAIIAILEVAGAIGHPVLYHH